MSGERRAISQLDVARRAGVSRTTVSFVLNGQTDAGISEATRRRVLDAARELGFQPNALARALRGQRSHVIGLLTDDIATTPYAVEIVKGAQEAAFAAGRTLLIVDTHGEADAGAEALAMMRGWQVDGIVYATDFHREVTPPVGLADIPSVLVDCVAPGSGIPSVVPDERQGGRLATQTLIEAGHRRIGIITGPAEFPASSGRLGGYREALAAAGIDFDPVLVRTGDWWQESGYACTRDLMGMAEPPSALFCGNDWMAMGAYDALRDLSLSIPGDVAVIGFDDRREIADHMRPRLSTVALPYEEMGRHGVTRLIARIASGDGGPLDVALACPLVRRDSVQ